MVNFAEELRNLLLDMATKANLREIIHACMFECSDPIYSNYIEHMGIRI